MSKLCEDRLDALLRFGHEEAVRALGPTEAERLRALTWARFYALAPKAPTFEARVNRKLFVLAVPLLALYQALREDLGRSQADALRIAEDMLLEMYREKLTKAKIAALDVVYGFAPLRRLLVKQMVQTDEPQGFHFEVLPDPSVVLALDVHACPITTFAKEQGAPEIVPLICRLDELVAEKLSGLALERTGTLGMGADKCDFRYVEKKRT